MSWEVYLLYNVRTRRTYIGATTNAARRLRQHRGEIKGGARATQRGRAHWTFVCKLSGFKTKSEAYRWEKILKMRAVGLMQRYRAFQRVTFRDCPIHPKKPYLPAYPVPAGLSLHFLPQSEVSDWD